MLGIGVFLGDRAGAGRTFQQVRDGPLPSMAVGRFVKETAAPDRFARSSACTRRRTSCRSMQCSRVQCAARREAAVLPLVARRRTIASETDDFLLKQEFLAVMLGVRRPTVTVVLRSLQQDGLISSRYGRIRILKRKQLEQASCECYDVIRAHFVRLGL